MFTNSIQQLIVHGTGDGQEYLHTLHFRQVTPAFASEAAASDSLLTSWEAVAKTAWLALHGPGYNLSFLSAQRVCGTVPLPSPRLRTVNAVGTRVITTLGERLAPWLSTAVRETTGFAGRSYRGRFFVSGLFELDVSVGAITGQYQSLLNAYVGALNNAYLFGGTDINWRQFVFSRVLAAVPGTQCQNAGADVTGNSPTGVLTSMRSRRSATGL